jgi:uncharacterized protein YfaS (alpha-2-macroglobulin family)
MRNLVSCPLLSFSLAVLLILPGTAHALAKAAYMKHPAWKDVERLVNVQKFEEAATAVAKIREATRAAGAEREWARALVEEVQLRTALHGYETSVRFLREQPWPKGFVPHLTLDLFYARSLITYLQSYGWEIRQREKTESKGPVDLKAWTQDQIFEEATKAYQDAWKNRAELSREPVQALAEYLEPNTFPPHIRGTLRDAVSYLTVEIIGDTSQWRPEQSAEVYRLPFKALLAGDPSAARAARIDDPSIHPLERVLGALDDLEAWHRREGHKEAAFEARLERDRRLAASFKDPAELEAVRKDLEAHFGDVAKLPWWSMGKALLAEMVREHTQDLVRARAIALEGHKAFPDSIGGKRCLHIAKSIEQPDYQMQLMASDGPSQRSLEITHKNLAELHFRAYAVDLTSQIAKARDYNLLPHGDEAQVLVRTGKPAAQWTVALPSTPDFKSHRTFVTPPLQTKGAYVIVASAMKEFSEGNNRILSGFLVVTDLVLLSRQDDGDMEVTALSGTSGLAMAAANVMLYEYNYQSGHREVAKKATGKDGVVHFPRTGVNPNNSHFLLGRKGDDWALDASSVSFYRYDHSTEQQASLVYTDRSIYRPQQKLFWKVLAYRGKHADASFKAAPGATLSVSLHDGNHQQVETKTVTTNAHGTASGEFVIPGGRVLGQWRIVSSWNGNTYVRVEEYKRPTFEVTLKEAATAARLNRPTTLNGEAKYYFGLPVTNGQVRWRVSREPVYPYWWGWFYGHFASRSQTFATGVSPLKPDGSFSLTFTPEADERKGARSKDITYRYQVTADLTDEGGETRSASRGFRLGLVSVEARASLEVGFLTAGTESQVRLARTNLDGAPRPGKGAWRVVALKTPEKAVVPSELPMPKALDDGAEKPFQTPGDKLRPRWDRSASPVAIMASWEEGKEVARGEAVHGENGEAKAALHGLAPGAYRLLYETQDDFGVKAETFLNFIVASNHPPLPVPLLLQVERGSVTVGGTARILVHSGLPEQPITFEIHRGGKLAERRVLEGGGLLELKVSEKDRGGFGISAYGVRDHQYLGAQAQVHVPWDNKELKVEFATFRDKLRPGTKETFRVTVKGAAGDKAAVGAAELLAYMYDRSLDLFGPHSPPSPMSLWPFRGGVSGARATLSVVHGQSIFYTDFRDLPEYPYLSSDSLRFYDSYGVGGPGRRFRNGHGLRQANGGRMRGAKSPAASASGGPPSPAPAMTKSLAEKPKPNDRAELGFADGEADDKSGGARKEPEGPALRTNFSETAFFYPHLLTDKSGAATIEFTVPDSVTSWNVWVHAITQDLRSGSIRKETRSVKDLMVRPYLPRFFREGDKAELKVVVNNASDRELGGKLTFEIFDPDTNQSLLSAFGLSDAVKSFSVPKGGGTNLTFPVTAPRKVGPVAFRVTATAGDVSDGELRPLPVLPSRMHLVQSRFVTLRDKDARTMTFEDLAKNDDPTLINEQMVVTVDAQLFYTVLKALPYLVDYPYECTEQTMNRFVSTGIVTSMYKDFPAVAKMAVGFGKRETRLDPWALKDPNRKMTLEESPWLQTARGGEDTGHGLINVLDPKIARATRDEALAKLRKVQTSIGGFPWFPGGPPSPYMTLYLMHGFAKAVEFGVDVPKDMVQRGWQYLAQHFRSEYASHMIRDDCCWEFLTFLNYVASSYPDSSWTSDALTLDERKQILNFTFGKWKKHSPYLKGYLALTLKRMDRLKDGQLVFQSVMDSAKTALDQGTFWAQEDRSWLWYNDTIETHAFALRTLMELEPKNAKKDGLVLWLFLNKKLNQWKSTRATAEVVYSLAHYLKKENALAVRESATVTVGPKKTTFTFEPDQYVGKTQIIVPGEQVDPTASSTITIEKATKGFMFASATWHFSTDKLPADDRGDFFHVSRKYFKRENTGKEFVLRPLAEGASVQPGDEVEIQLSLRTKHAAEYVHLRDPRAAGLEPENAVSRYKWDLGIGWYEEVRDSGTNFFFEQLPVGEYTFKYRLRANMAGTFRIGPATVQSMYAPEFNAYSAGHVLTVASGGK